MSRKKIKIKIKKNKINQDISYLKVGQNSLLKKKRKEKKKKRNNNMKGWLNQKLIVCRGRREKPFCLKKAFHRRFGGAMYSSMLTWFKWVICISLNEIISASPSICLCVCVCFGVIFAFSFSFSSSSLRLKGFDKKFGKVDLHGQLYFFLAL